YNSTFVTGGKPDFEQGLYNIGATYRATEHLTLFGSYSQGFGMPDVGRVLRGINQPGLSVESFLSLAPIVTDNCGLGLRWQTQRWRAAFSAYRSGSDLG